VSALGRRYARATFTFSCPSASCFGVLAPERELGASSAALSELYFRCSACDARYGSRYHAAFDALIPDCFEAENIFHFRPFKPGSAKRRTRE
jgi:hypothetical protein